jgi:hypothetical protein
MTETLTHADIRDLLRGFGAAIELDQLRVDAMPAAKFQPPYNDSMWRGWRGGHISYTNKLLSTVDAIPSAMLRELTGIAVTYEPELIRHIALELFAEVVTGSCPQEELGTAERFFGWLIKQVGAQSEGRPRHQGARTSILQWLPVTDPLRIAQDPECGYGQPDGFVS